MKALVLFSGGVDSSTCLGMAVSRYGAENVVALSVQYGQKHEKEVEAAEKIARYYNVELVRLDLTPIFAFSDWIFSCITSFLRDNILKLFRKTLRPEGQSKNLRPEGASPDPARRSARPFLFFAFFAFSVFALRGGVKFSLPFPKSKCLFLQCRFKRFKTAQARNPPSSRQGGGKG